MPQKPHLDRPALASGLLVLAALTAYLPVFYLDFLNYDDPLYVTSNEHVQKGLTFHELGWAFSHFHAANWHPLTWLSHILDCQLYSLRAAGHHFTNFLFHVMNSVVLFLWLRSMTRAGWRSAFVAALFALHPLHVESVAWVAERKDVLSALFGLLSLWVYAQYAKEPRVPSLKSGVGRRPTSDRLAGATDPRHASGFTFHVSRYYLISLTLFALGLMSKPMLVTWPFVMLLLDFWPLGRAGSRWSSLVVEKIPFFMLSAASSVVTVQAQRAGEAVVSLQALPLEARVANALVGYVRYLGKILWPTDLAVFYPAPAGPTAWGLAAAALLVLAGGALLAFRQRKKRPYLLVGLAWYLGTLVPVIGLAQVGNQSIADRYTYLPAIGVFLILAWGGAELAALGRNAHRAVVAAASIALVACSLATGSQLLYWQNSETLFRHALAVTKNNFVAWNNVGFYLAEHRELRQAEACYRAAIAANPSFAEAWYNLGCTLADLNRNAEAIAAFEAALRLTPRLIKVHNNLATVLAADGRIEAARTQLREASRLDPHSAQPHSNLGVLLAGEGNWDEAVAEFKQALALEPGMTEAVCGLSGVLAKQGHHEEAVVELSGLLKRQPANVPARLQLGGILALQGKTDLALDEYAEVLRVNPRDPMAHYRMAATLMRQGRAHDAIEHYRAALDARPTFPEALNNLAWVLATHPDAQFRNGPEAVRLALKACQATGFQQAFTVGTLAAAYAEAGQFSEAIATAEKAKGLAEKAGDKDLASRTGKLLELYRAGQPCRDPE
jgi:tetratricopeptide (TPR) repeat protein